MRNAFINELVTQATLNNQVALVVGDLGYSVVEPFADRFPERFINAGVAEQNMTGLAAGMASEGYHVFIYSIANFPTFRCAEQIRNDIDYHNLPVTIVAVGGGVAYGNLGYSHHAVQDYALIRCMPNMLIAAPGDPMEVRSCLSYLIQNPQPSYLRLGKAGEPCYHAAPPSVAPGKWLKVATGADGDAHCLLTTGATLDMVMQSRNRDAFGNKAIYSLPLWGMKCKPSQARQLKMFEQVTTIEDHLYDAGFGSWLMEAVAGDSKLLGRLRGMALNSKVCGMVGSEKVLRTLVG